MARRRKASSRDMAELRSGKASARDRAEAGVTSKFKRALKRGRGGPTKRRRRSGR